MVVLDKEKVERSNWLDIDVFRRNPDLLAMLKARVAEHPEERRGWRHVLDAL